MALPKTNSPAAKITAKGQITIPKAIRSKYNLNEGDSVVFVEEEGKLVVKKAALVAFEDFANKVRQDSEKKGITEEELLAELENVRQEMWDERNKL